MDITYAMFILDIISVPCFFLDIKGKIKDISKHQTLLIVEIISC